MRGNNYFWITEEIAISLLKNKSGNNFSQWFITFLIYRYTMHKCHGIIQKSKMLQCYYVEYTTSFFEHMRKNCRTWIIGFVCRAVTFAGLASPLLSQSQISLITRNWLSIGCIGPFIETSSSTQRRILLCSLLAKDKVFYCFLKTMNCKTLHTFCFVAPEWD